MAQPGPITLYTHLYSDQQASSNTEEYTGSASDWRAIYSPFCHRVEIALHEAKADYTSYHINLMDKPTWYAAKVNAAEKIPVIAYGGPKVAPEEPAAESAKIDQSLVILEFLADLFPEANLLPTDPVLRASARLAITTWEEKAFVGLRDFVFAYDRAASGTDPEKALLDGLEAFQTRLPPTGFAVGKWSNADSAVAPFLLLEELLLKYDLGKFPKGEGAKVYQILQGAKFERLRKYIEDVKEYPIIKATWDEAVQFEIWSKNPRFKRA